jgi:hypothetical protein
MPDLGFKVTGVQAAARGVTPLLQFNLALTNEPETEIIQAVILHTQIQIQAPRRVYNGREKAALIELFGPPEQWGQTLRNRLWAVSHTTVSTFAGRAEALLAVPCTYDLNVTATKYFYALESGEAPLLFLFSGTVFYAAPDGHLQVQQIPWNREATYPMPASAWRDLMETHYPNSAWLALRRDVFDRVYAYKRTHGLATWEQVMDELLPAQQLEEVAV